MEWKIGEIRQINSEWYQCIKGLGCNECDLSKITCYHRFESGSCSPNMRKDGTQVIFKKLEKIREPYFNGQYGKVLQEYKYYIPPITTDLRIHIIKLGIVGIEIKQNQEDMKEKKIKISKEDATYLLNELHYILDERLNGEGSDKVMDDIIQILDIEQPNLKPFNLEAAKAGKPVCTRDGRKARIICFDTKGDPCPIIALVEENGIEVAYHYDKNGQNAYNKSDLDLMMLSEKKEGWVNVYKVGSSRNVENLYSSKEEAEKHRLQDWVATTKIEWKE